MDIKIEPNSQAEGSESSSFGTHSKLGFRKRRYGLKATNITSNPQPSIPQCCSPPAPPSPVFVLTLPEYEIQVRPRQPRCHTCNEVAVRMTTRPQNETNAGRAYYICPSCPWECRWVCWADTKGMSTGNPLCDCVVPSRMDIMGQSKGERAGMAFWTCVTGNCRYYSEHRNGERGVNYDYGGFYP